MNKLKFIVFDHLGQLLSNRRHKPHFEISEEAESFGFSIGPVYKFIWFEQNTLYYKFSNFFKMEEGVYEIESGQEVVYYSDKEVIKECGIEIPLSREAVEFIKKEIDGDIIITEKHLD